MQKEQLETMLEKVKSEQSDTVSMSRADVMTLIQDALREKARDEEEMEFRKEAFRYENAKLSSFLWTTDWDDPDKTALKKLKYKAGELVDEAEDREIDDDSLQVLQAFSEGKKEIDGDKIAITDVVNICKTYPCDEPLSIEHEHVFEVVMTIGGPYHAMHIHTDENGEMNYIESVYGSGGKSYSNRLYHDMEQDIWSQYEDYVKCMIEEGQNNSPRY